VDRNPGTPNPETKDRSHGVSAKDNLPNPAGGILDQDLAASSEGVAHTSSRKAGGRSVTFGSSNPNSAIFGSSLRCAQPDTTERMLLAMLRCLGTFLGWCEERRIEANDCWPGDLAVYRRRLLEDGRTSPGEYLRVARMLLVELSTR
jgi:hypothetical protein